MKEKFKTISILLLGLLLFGLVGCGSDKTADKKILQQTKSIMII